jgi:Xaa-Pro dipeptidase
MSSSSVAETILPPPKPELVDADACRGRQRRLIDVMRAQQLDLVIVARIEHVQWLVGPRYAATFSPLAALTADGELTLVAPNQPPARSAADNVTTYEAQWLSTLRNDQGVAAAESLAGAIGGALAGGSRPPRVGVEFSACSPAVVSRLPADVKLVDIEPELYLLRRQKDSSELAKLKMAIAGTAAMHARAREIIAPGVNELFVFSELQAVAVRTYGEMLTGTGNDYACGVPGGPPRDRKIEAGELYILDLGPAFQGYFADNTRVYAVDGRPTTAQRRAWETIMPVFELVERFVRPGASCRKLFFEVKALLDQGDFGTFDHHLGHGIGLYPHEAPHLNSSWDDVFQVGEVFAVEPGLYTAELRGGIRLENNYRVTEDGVELLTPFPLEL